MAALETGTAVHRLDNPLSMRAASIWRRTSSRGSTLIVTKGFYPRGTLLVCARGTRCLIFSGGIKRSVEWRATLRKSHGEESNLERPGHGWCDLEVRSANEAAWAAAWVAAAWAAQQQ